jgi:hypothetical protein
MNLRIADDELLIKRTFDVPASVLFALWSKPEHVKRLGVEELEAEFFLPDVGCVNLTPSSLYRSPVPPAAGP